MGQGRHTLVVAGVKVAVPIAVVHILALPFEVVLVAMGALVDLVASVAEDVPDAAHAFQKALHRACGGR